MHFKLMLLSWQHLISKPKFYYITKLPDKFEEKSTILNCLTLRAIQSWRGHQKHSTPLRNRVNPRIARRVTWTPISFVDLKIEALKKSNETFSTLNQKMNTSFDVNWMKTS